MKRVEVKRQPVKRGESFQLVFGAMFHDGDKVNAEAEYPEFSKMAKPVEYLGIRSPKP